MGDEEGLPCIEACPECWKEGCGLDGCFGMVADGLEAINPAMEYCADCIWIMGSPLAFPIIFCFQPGADTEPPNGGWQISMLSAPIKKPLECCCYTIFPPCGQWYMRKKALKDDMSKYKLWQGYHDGPQCLARRCPGAPITIEAGTYGEDKCPEAFLCLEVWCLGCWWSPCCAFDVTRRMVKNEYNLVDDPTEVRVNKCIAFFSRLANYLCMLSCCVCISSCCIGCCAPDSEGAQDCSDQGQRAASSCNSCAATCWRGIYSVKMIAMGCMSAQMDHELKHDTPLESRPVRKQEMDRGLDDDNDDEEDQWWKKPE